MKKKNQTAEKGAISGHLMGSSHVDSTYFYVDSAGFAKNRTLVPRSMYRPPETPPDIGLCSEPNHKDAFKLCV